MARASVIAICTARVERPNGTLLLASDSTCNMQQGGAGGVALPDVYNGRGTDEEPIFRVRVQIPTDPAKLPGRGDICIIERFSGVPHLLGLWYIDYIVTDTGRLKSLLLYVKRQMTGQ